MSYFHHQCTGCSYSVILPEDESSHSVCPRCGFRFHVTPTDEPAIKEDLTQ